MVIYINSKNIKPNYKKLIDNIDYIIIINDIILIKY